MTGQQEMFPQHHGYSGKRTAEIVGITYRQLDYWARTDLIRPSLAEARGAAVVAATRIRISSSSR